MTMGPCACAASFLLLLPCVLACVRVLRVRSWGRFHAPPGLSLRGRVAVVTGAASGLGLATARALASHGATVVLACRSDERAIDAKRRLLKELAAHPPQTPFRDEDLVPMEVDLASLASVRAFASRLAQAFPRLHLLVCNAGVYFPASDCPRTADGFEAHLGINHLSHFELTNLLLPLLEAGRPSRVVVVASALAERAARGFSAACVPPGYPSSKLCNVLFARELSGRCAGRGVSAYAVCPGFCLTGLFRSRRLRWWHYALMAPVALLFMRTPEQGAQTILHCALSDEEALESGGVYRDCRRYEPKALAALPPTLPRELWLASERMVAQAHELAL